MLTQHPYQLDLFVEKLREQEAANRLEFKFISRSCEHRKDNSGKHGMYAQVDTCKASGIRTLKSCDITTCPAIH